jgi:hypothetical protein
MSYRLVGADVVARGTGRTSAEGNAFENQNGGCFLLFVVAFFNKDFGLDRLMKQTQDNLVARCGKVGKNSKLDMGTCRTTTAS